MGMKRATDNNFATALHPTSFPIAQPGALSLTKSEPKGPLHPIIKVDRTESHLIKVIQSKNSIKSNLIKVNRTESK